MFRGSAYSMQTDKELGNSNHGQMTEYSIKIALVGVSDVGKSSIINCIEQDIFREDIPPTKGFQLRFKKLRISSNIVNLSVWDGAGNRMLQFIKQGQFKDFDGVLYVFDLLDSQSMINLEQLHYEIKQSYSQDMISLLAGNKADLLPPLKKNDTGYRNQTDYHAQKFSKRHNMLYLKISAKDNHFVTDCFVELIKEILRVMRFVRTSRLLEEEEKQAKNNSNILYCPNLHCSKCQIY